MSDLTLGDLLDSAARHLEAAGATGDAAAPDGASGTWQLHRLVTAMTRYLRCPGVSGQGSNRIFAGKDGGSSDGEHET